MIHAYDPRTGESFGEPIAESTDAGGRRGRRGGHAAAPAWRAAARPEVLEAIASALEANVEELWTVADRETALGETRLRGEVARAASQFRLFAEVLRDGGHLEAVHLRQADVRRMNHPLPGVVGVFSASNFPFASPSRVGGHRVGAGGRLSCRRQGAPAHPLTSELSAGVIRSAHARPRAARAWSTGSRRQAPGAASRRGRGGFHRVDPRWQGDPGAHRRAS
ncbi:aldehyde dehydrogenase family protein [Nonomuraea dietziae]|uniref:aldehyde dehydrogenase family protein n=1 Tax=Nonomuraea dietziae TaxID=65515 RepID=UPI0031D48E6B